MCTNKLKFLFLLVIFALSQVACTTTRVSLHTNPTEAEVYAKSVGSGQMQLLGRTPLQLTNRELIKSFGGSGALIVELRRDGYKTDTFYVTELSKIDLNITRDLVPKRDLEVQTWLNNHIAEMFEVKRLVQAGRYDEGLRIVQELKKETPMVATLHEMEGGIYLMKREYKSALDAYRIALKYDNERTEASKMVKYIESTFGFAREVDISETKSPPPAIRPQESRVPAQESPTSEPAKEGGP